MLLHRDELTDGIEEALIGAVLTAKDEPVPPLMVEEFFLGRFQTIWQAILTVREQGQRADLVTVTHELRRSGQLEAAGGVVTLVACVEAGCLALHTADYAERVRAAATARRLRQLGADLSAQGFSADEVQTRLGQIPRPRTVRPFSGSDLWQLTQLGWLEAPILLGLPDVDRSLRLRPGDLAVVGGRTSHGKTAFLVSATVQMIADGVSVAYVSLETPAEAIWRRAIAVRGRLSIAAIRGGSLTATELQIADGVSEWLASRSWVIRDVKALGTKRADRVLEALAVEDAEVLILDHVQEVLTEGESRALELSLFFACLKEIALARSRVILCASQLSRLTDRTRRGTWPVLADLKESGGIEERADQVLLLHHPAKAGDTQRGADELDVIIAKNRDGETGRRVVRFDARVGLVEPWTERRPSRED